ncbi:MAG: hypothetical protein K8T89_23090 [Planctomycetes bacterium]|nr:hypothetical protein [Planctomycetota bacterium]
MRRALLSLALMTGMLGFTTMGVEAQQKKDTPKTEKKEEKAGGIEIYKGKNGFRYRIIDAEGKTVAMPLANKAWETKEEVLKALDELKATLNKAKPVDAKD